MPLSSTSTFFKEFGCVDVTIGLRLRDTEDLHQVLCFVAELIDEHEGNILPVVGFQLAGCDVELVLGIKPYTIVD